MVRESGARIELRLRVGARGRGRGEVGVDMLCGAVSRSPSSERTVEMLAELLADDSAGETARGVKRVLLRWIDSRTRRTASSRIESERNRKRILGWPSISSCMPYTGTLWMGKSYGVAERIVDIARR